MKVKIFVMLAAIMSLGILIPQGAYAVPYVDTGFISITPGDMDLIVVRENYLDDTSYQQSIYFRAYEGSATWKALGGTISFSDGIEIVEVIGLGANLYATDSTWGVPGTYSEESGNRGINYGGSYPDILAIDFLNDTITFDLATKAGCDDFRVIIDYGDSWLDGAYLDIDLFSSDLNRYGDPYEIGIQVGLFNPAVDGSGDWLEVASLTVPLTPEGTPSHSPEPSTMLLFGCGLVGLGLFGRKRFRK